jgi:hypothetical protein
LQEINPNLFKEKEIEFLELKVEMREQHLRDSLEHVSKGHRKQIVVFLDNADQRDDQTQQQVFLIAQELAEHWPVTVFVSLRPETFYRSISAGALSGYHPKAFTIAPPRVDRVIEKRLEFAIEITSGKIPVQSLPDSTRVQLVTLEKILRIFLRSLNANQELKVFIDNISGGNVRLALELVKGYFGSGHVNTQEMLRIFDDTGNYIIPLHHFLRAVIYSDAEHYDPQQSPVANLFDVSRRDGREHFLLPMLLGYLIAASGPGVEDGFVETAKVYEVLQPLGFAPEQIDAAIISGYRKKLLESVARRIPKGGVDMPQALRITTVGHYHLARLCRTFTYLDAIIVDTPILDSRARDAIKNVHTISDRLNRALTFLQYLVDHPLEI